MEAPSTHRQEMEETFNYLNAAFTLQKEMTKVANPQQLVDCVRRTILEKQVQLCVVVNDIGDAKPKISDLEALTYLTRMVRMKVDLYAESEVAGMVDRTMVDDAMAAIYKQLEWF